MKILGLLLCVWGIGPVCTRAQPCDSLGAVHWLLGDWVAQDAKRITRESWRQISPDTFEGAGSVTSRATMDVQSSESMRLVAMSGEVFYIAKAAHNTLPIGFKLVRCTHDTALFENPDHDFPKQLTYRRGDRDSLIVHVSDGASRGFTLRFGQSPGP